MESDFLRYSCQLALPGFTEETQNRLQNARVLLVGAGGLGCPAAQYLVAAGIGTIGIVDFDVISISNLHRQILYTPQDVGMKKAIVACNKLQEQNAFVKLIPYETKIVSENVMKIISPYDIIIDGTDNFETRYLLNDACVLQGKPLIYGAIYQYEGQVAVWNVANDDNTRSPNYRDIFPEVDATQIPDCTVGGVIPTLAGIIGCMQANEVIKYVTGIGELLAGKLLMLDAQTLQSRIIKIDATTKTSITALTPTEHVPTISIKELKDAIDLYDLIDVRNNEERKIFNIGGKHIPVSEIENETSYLHSDRPIIFYCASGKRSAEIVKLIKRKFPDLNVFSLEGGIKAWMEYQ